MGSSNKSLLNLLSGIVFVVLWASASSATKIGLHSVQPLVLSIPRFILASALMLSIAHFVMKQPLPANKVAWKKIAIYGFFNVGLYLGLYVVAMQEVSAGLGSLFIAINPVLIMLISTIWFRQPLKVVTVLSFTLCMAGMLLAAYPLLGGSHASALGLLLLLLSNISYSVGAIYFSKQNWQGMHILTINGWQTLFGCLYLLPFALFFYRPEANIFDLGFLGAVVWLAIPASIIASLLWMALLRDNPTKASAWLFLCPIAGFAIAAMIMKEPLTWYTLAGVILVIAGLYMVQRMKIEKAKANV
ncbi:MAG: EamA family transporter [Chitinophagaceae bacterium]|nr:MAG: EamA family transporter [Chitinophagaceae bacterium]